uniref:Uncharacterized protein n=1 Tax=Mustela putorius furo TaxID=9669 RepID=M3XV56_MUSPF
MCQWESICRNTIFVSRSESWTQDPTVTSKDQVMWPLQEPPRLLPAEHAGALQASSALHPPDVISLRATTTYQDGSRQPRRARELLLPEMYRKYKIHP